MASPDSPFLAEQLRGTVIAREIGRTNRSLFIVNALLVLGVAGCIVVTARYLTNFVQGPVPMLPSQVTWVENPNSLARYFVSVTGDKIVDSGIRHVERHVNETTNEVLSETVDADFLILVVDQRLLIVKAPHGAKGMQFQGALVDLPAEVRSKVVGKVNDPELVRSFLPVMLDARNFRAQGYWTIAICVPILGLAGWNLRKYYARVRNPNTHPIIVTLGRFGSVPRLAMEIEGELRGQTEALGTARVTPSWIFISHTFGLLICRIPEIVWAYAKVTRHCKYFIPTGASYAAIIFGRDGRPIQVDGSHMETNRLLEIVASRAPWALMGFSEESSKLVHSNWPGFVAEIDARRAKAAGASAT